MEIRNQEEYQAAQDKMDTMIDTHHRVIFSNDPSDIKDEYLSLLEATNKFSNGRKVNDVLIAGGSLRRELHTKDYYAGKKLHTTMSAGGKNKDGTVYEYLFRTCFEFKIFNGMIIVASMPYTIDGVPSAIYMSSPSSPTFIDRWGEAFEMLPMLGREIFDSDIKYIEYCEANFLINLERIFPLFNDYYKDRELNASQRDPYTYLKASREPLSDEDLE